MEKEKTEADEEKMEKEKTEADEEKSKSESNAGDSSANTSAANGNKEGTDQEEDRYFEDASGQPFWLGRVAWADLFDPRYWEMRTDTIIEIVHAKMLREINDGEVYRHTIRGHDMIVKLLRYDGRLRDVTKEDIRDRAVRERIAYAALAELQGDCIPKLFYAGPHIEDVSDCVATSYEGTPLDGKNVTVDSAFVQKTLAIFNRIHEAGVLHRDPALRNILIHPVSGNPIVIDFSESKMLKYFDDPEDAIANEIATLEYKLSTILVKPASKKVSTDADAVTKDSNDDLPSKKRRLESELA